MFRWAIFRSILAFLFGEKNVWSSIIEGNGANALKRERISILPISREGSGKLRHLFNSDATLLARVTTPKHAKTFSVIEMVNGVSRNDMI